MNISNENIRWYFVEEYFKVMNNPNLDDDGFLAGIACNHEDGAFRLMQ